MSFEPFHFLRPLWLLALLVLPILLWLVWRPSRDAGDWRHVIDPELMPHVLADPPKERQWRSGLWTAVVWLVTCLALAGPAWERIDEPVLETQQARALVLSLSDSMLAVDLRPDRLTRARLKLADLIAESRGQHLGLVVYAGDAFTVAPLTEDGRTLLVQLDVLHPQLMPVQGARADLGIRRAAMLLRDAGFPGGDIVLLTDTADSRVVQAAAEAVSQGMRVSVLGFGTVEGAPVPLAEGGFRRDATGNIVLPRLDEAQLAAVARAGRGQYQTARGDRSDVQSLVGASAIMGREGDAQRSMERYLDRGPWLTLALLPLALIAWRRGTPLLLVVCLVMPSENILADTPVVPVAAAADTQWHEKRGPGFRGLWQRQDQQAHAALLQGDHARARALANDPARRGAAAFREQDFEAAARAFATGTGATDRYNLGNALAMAGHYQDAIAAYQEALALNPGMEDAQANLDAVRAWLEQQPQQPAEGDESEEEGDDGQDTESSATAEEDQGTSEDDQNERGEGGGQAGGDEGQEGADGRDDAGHQPGDDGQDEQSMPTAEYDTQMMDQAAQALARELEEAMQSQQEGEMAELDATEREADEQRQMIEQWLRRVPDDPGALLRRKFAVEHHRRQGGER